MAIKLLATDLDGTLVADMHTVPPRTQRAIKAAMNRGVRVIIATGREYPVTKKFVARLGLTTPVICYQGALIVDPLTEQPLASEGFSLPLAHRLIDLARRHQLALHLYLNNRAYTETTTTQSRTMLNGIGTPITQVNNLKLVVTTPPIKAIIVHPAHEAAEIVKRLRADLGGSLSVFRSLDTLIEVTAPDVSKGQALARLAAHYGIARQEVMAIGDQDNDIDMIAWAGLGVAMGNASPAAKVAADIIAPPIEEEGAAWVIEQFILGEHDE